MKITKRISALLLGLLLAMSLAACGADDTPKKEFSAGVTDGNTYTNEYFGFTATLDESWTFFTSDEIAQLTGQVVDLLDNEAVAEAYASGKSVVEMYAMRDDNATLNLTVENLGEEYGTQLTEEDYADVSLDILPDQLTAAGYTDVSVSKTTLTFAGAEHYAVTVSASIQGMPLQEMLACVKVGDYVAVVTAASYGAETPAELLSAFHAL